MRDLIEFGFESEGVRKRFSCTVHYERSLYYVEFETLSLRIILYQSCSPRFESCILRCESLKETYPYATFIAIFVEIEPTSAME